MEAECYTETSDRLWNTRLTTTFLDSIFIISPMLTDAYLSADRICTMIGIAICYQRDMFKNHHWSLSYEENVHDSSLLYFTGVFFFLRFVTVSFTPRKFSKFITAVFHKRNFSRFITDILHTKNMFKIRHWYPSHQEHVQDSSLMCFTREECSRFITDVVQTKNMFKIHHWCLSHEKNVQDSSLISFRPRTCSRFIIDVCHTKRILKIY
jgi:hypothetical protein